MKNVLLHLQLLCVILTGCIHKATPVTPWERTMTDNALLAQFVDTAEQGTEAANASGVLSDDTARPVIKLESSFADVHEKITVILNLGPSADLSQATSLLQQFETQAQDLVNSGEIGIKNPKTQMTISADLRNVISLVQALLADIQLVKTGATP